MRGQCQGQALSSAGWCKPGPLRAVKPDQHSHCSDLLSPNCRLVEGLLIFTDLQASANYLEGFYQARVKSQVSEVE